MSATPVYNAGKVEAKIDKCIDETVAGLVERELETFISKELRERVDKQRTDMQRLQVAIHNSLSILHANTRDNSSSHR